MSPNGNNDVVVRTVGLTKVFRDFWLREKVTAVRDLNLEIHAGEVYGLLGPNGSGKSTTLKMILSLLFPTRGTVTVFGKTARDASVRARIGFLPEESYLYPFLDAYETLDYYGRLFGQPRYERKRRIQMLLDMVGLTGSAYRRIGEYSKGMQRRIGMAQALINDPDLLILDEPTSGMDPLAARQFKDLIRELVKRGKTIIISSHLLADMEDVCDRVGILFAGELRAEGTLDSLLNQSNLTQIITERLDEHTIEQIQQALQQRNKEIVSITAPKDRLEDLFLKIINQAQTQKQITEVVRTGEVAEFLRATPEQEGKKLIEELTSKPEQQAPQEQPAEQEQPVIEEKPDTEIIEELTSREEQPIRQTESPTAPPPSTEKETKQEVDRSVIESLIRKEDTEDTPDA